MNEFEELIRAFAFGILVVGGAMGAIALLFFAFQLGPFGVLALLCAAAILYFTK